MRASLLTIVSVLVYLNCMAAPAYAEQEELAGKKPVPKEMAGRMEALVNGKAVLFPSLRTEIYVDLQGDLANVEVTQVFENPSTEPIHATYLFPLNKDAAVHALTMEVGDEIVRAQIKEKREAEKIFKRAKEQGKAAGLLRQHRPNMFTQDIANLMPGLPITVRISYVQSVRKVGGEHELVVPLVVGPRYQPVSGKTRKEEGGKKVTEGQWQLGDLPTYPDVAGVTIPDTIDFERVRISVSLNGGMPISRFYSPTHGLHIQKKSKELFTASLAKGKTLDNSDFVLRYGLEAESTQAGILTHKNGQEAVFSLLLEAPSLPKKEDITPRELVFVLDTSGSMEGRPLNACKSFMKHALGTLRQGDYFRVVRFGSSASQFAERPVDVTPEHLKQAVEYVNALQAGGGTEFKEGINLALDTAAPNNTLRVVVFLTDGYIGNEAEVLRLLKKKLGKARLYAFGVGNSVNRYLLAEMASVGRGFSRVLGLTEDYEDVAIGLAGKLDAPVLTDIRVNWGTLKVEDATPARLPDLFAGQTLRLQGRYLNPGTHKVTVSGLSNGRKATIVLNVDFPAESNGTHTKAIPLTWARSLIRDHMRAYNTPVYKKETSLSTDHHKDRVVELGLKYALLTRWTSFVAVSEKRYNTQGVARHANVPLPKVKDVSNAAYPHKQTSNTKSSAQSTTTRTPSRPMTRVASNSSFSSTSRSASPSTSPSTGHSSPSFFSVGSTPEPGTLLGMLLLGAASGFGALRKRFWRARR